MTPLQAMSNQELYQKLYDDPKRKYGQGEYGRSPGVRMIPLYKKHLYGKIIDFGCGTGDTVITLRKMKYNVTGYDFVEPTKRHCFQQDITKPIALYGHHVALCMDVFEHLGDSKLLGLLANMKKCQRQIISINNGSSKDGEIELHINRKPFEEWEELLNEHFRITEKIHRKVGVHGFQKLYICERKK